MLTVMYILWDGWSVAGSTAFDHCVHLTDPVLLSSIASGPELLTSNASSVSMC